MLTILAFSHQFIYVLSSPNGNMQLYQFVIIFGVLKLVLAQIPSFHNLRHINMLSLILALVYCTCATAGSVSIGYYSSTGEWEDVQRSMWVLSCCNHNLFSVALSGYWAFGNQAKGTVLQNFMVDDKPLLPTWVLLMTNVFTFLQVAAISVVYLQPTNEALERKFVDAKMVFSIQNVVPRLVYPHYLWS